MKKLITVGLTIFMSGGAYSQDCNDLSDVIGYCINSTGKSESWYKSHRELLVTEGLITHLPNIKTYSASKCYSTEGRADIPLVCKFHEPAFENGKVILVSVTFFPAGNLDVADLNSYLKAKVERELLTRYGRKIPSGFSVSSGKETSLLIMSWNLGGGHELWLAVNELDSFTRVIMSGTIPPK